MHYMMTKYNFWIYQRIFKISYLHEYDPSPRFGLLVCEMIGITGPDGADGPTGPGPPGNPVIYKHSYN